MQVVTSGSVKKLSTNKRKILNVDELNAYKVAYEKPIGGRDYFRYLIVPSFTFALFSFILLYQVWVSVLLAIFGFIYGLKVFLPKSIKKNYESISFNQRNKLINNMTQIMTDETKTVNQALSLAGDRLDGELKEDLFLLQARLVGADNDRIKAGFKEFISKYVDDIIFVQFIEQLETSMLEGRTNIDTMKDIKSYHNDMKKKQTEYEKKKQSHLRDMKTLMIVVVVFILAISFSFGFSTYIENFARNWIGYITCSIYMSVIFIFFRQFTKYLFDDSVLEVSL